VEQAVFGAVPDRTEWVRQAAAVPVGANGLFAYPPVGCSDATASGNVAHACIQGIDIGRHHRAHLYRAALEGMAFSMAADLLDFERHGIWPEQIRAVRKDGADAMWYGVVSSLLANLTGVPVEVWETDGAVGAALAAGIKMERRSDGDGRNIRAAADYRRERYEPDAFREQVWQAYLDWTTGRAGVESVGQPLDVALELQNREVTDSATDRAGALAAEQLKSVRTVLSGWARTMRHPALKAALAALDEGIAYDGPTFFLRRNGLARWSTAEDPFLQQLEQTVSGLSQQEVMVCQMLRKKLTTKEMATHLNLSLRGVETIRYRLRRKLGIPPGYSLRKYLDEIACGRGPVSEAGTSGDQGDKISG
jgi:xylulokinase